jgi:hypothetical protein
LSRFVTDVEETIMTKVLPINDVVRHDTRKAPLALSTGFVAFPLACVAAIGLGALGLIGPTGLVAICVAGLAALIAGVYAAASRSQAQRRAYDVYLAKANEAALRDALNRGGLDEESKAFIADFLQRQPLTTS